MWKTEYTSLSSVVLCYFQCVHVTFNILIPVALRNAGGDIVMKVALFQGQVMKHPGHKQQA